MTKYPSNALLVSNENNTTHSSSSLRLTNDVKRYYSTTPTAHIRDLQADGVSASAQRVYIAIADRQTKQFGECFRSNAAIGEELGLHKNTVSRAIAQLKAKNYLSVWYVNGGRRMRVLTLVRRGVSAGSEGGKPQRVPDKENNIKKTTQQEKTVCAFLESFRELLGGQLDRLVSQYGENAVRHGLEAWKLTDQSRVDNSIGWITDAIKHRYPARPAKPAKFSQSIIDQEKIIYEYAGKSPENAKKVKTLYDDFEAKNGYTGSTITTSIAHKIYKGKI